MRNSVLGVECEKESVCEVVGQGEEVAEIPVRVQITAKRLERVLHEQVGGEETAENADVGFENLGGEG